MSIDGYIVAGIDIGSLTAKTVILNDSQTILSSNVVQRQIVDEAAANESLETAMQEAGVVTRKDIVYTVSTGYGRGISGFGDKDITEISCHGRGAHFLYPSVRTVIDIGGQDSKVILLNAEGNVVNFAMNDKCAAGTGRFLEVMASALGVPLSEMGEMALKSSNPEHVSSVCTVFAESEVISLVAKGKATIDIIAGINEAIARRMHGLVKTVGMKIPVLMSGGVAKNIGVVHFLGKALGVEIIVPEKPQIVGAIGAALYALDYAGQGK